MATQLDFATQGKRKQYLDPREFNFAAITPGGSLSVGSNTISGITVPTGVTAGTQVYISGGTGTAESVPVTAVGASSITVTCSYTHSGAWTIQSATAGINEAIRSVSGGVSVLLPVGVYSLYGPIVINKDSVKLSGAGTSGDLRDDGNPPPNIYNNAVLAWKGAAYATMMTVQHATASAWIHDIEVSKLTLDCAATAGVQLCGIAAYFYKTTGCLFEGLNIYGATTNGFLFDGGASADTIKRCRIRMYGAETRPDGATVGPCFQANCTLSDDFNACYVEDVQMWGNRYGMYMKNYDANEFHFIRFSCISGYSDPYAWYVPVDSGIHGGSLISGLTGGYRSDTADVGMDVIWAIEDDDAENHVLLGSGDAVLVYGKDNSVGITENYIVGPSNTTKLTLKGKRQFTAEASLSGGTATASAGAATLNKQSGTITSESLTTAAGANYTLTLTNSLISATSLVFANVFLGTSTQGAPQVVSCTPGSGSVAILIKNIAAVNALNGTIKIQFLVNNPN